LPLLVLMIIVLITLLGELAKCSKVEASELLCRNPTTADVVEMCSQCDHHIGNGSTQRRCVEKVLASDTTHRS
jgi:hypothetical protein